MLSLSGNSCGYLCQQVLQLANALLGAGIGDYGKEPVNPHAVYDADWL